MSIYFTYNVHFLQIKKPCHFDTTLFLFAKRDIGACIALILFCGLLRLFVSFDFCDRFPRFFVDHENFHWSKLPNISASDPLAVFVIFVFLDRKLFDREEASGCANIRFVFFQFLFGFLFGSE